jgi:hypothetical protein
MTISIDNTITNTITNTIIKNQILFDKLIDSIINDKLINLLTVISKNNPKTFKKEYIQKELDLIKTNLTKTNLTKTNLTKTNLTKNSKSSKKYKSTSQTKKIYIKKINSKNKCCARVWSNSILDKNTKKKVSEIDNVFKVIDFNDINNELFSENYTIGEQCKKNKYKNTNYCKLHCNHLIHGNYKEKPSKELCYHFMKDGKYL